ncbi:MAG: radical SAM protein, partial [Candidatus Omnitrophica bacterium]|nr:radical SAM protein [Candidatus Omnitrophota bacterium]
MKILISYPPLSGKKGYPTLGQNRQFQYFKDPTYIYPIVPAYAATLLKQAGHQVLWLDCIAEGLPYSTFIETIKQENPDLILFETKTPVVKQHWKIINDIKGQSPSGTVLKIALCGDHVTALPEESFLNSKVDFVLTGGDYDFLALNLCEHLGGKGVNLDPGIYYRDNGQVKNSGKFELRHDLDSLPFIDRELTKWQSYAYKNGNYKRTPGTYIMSGRDCWWGKCTFCSWGSFYPSFRSRSVRNMLDEIGYLIARYGIREIMDDTGTFPVGEWLQEFCNGMISTGYNKKIYLDCNMRFGALSDQDYSLMKQAGFRLLLFGLESANQDTLERINKKLKVQDIIDSCRSARKAGLFPHITIMFGYPWETEGD